MEYTIVYGSYGGVIADVETLLSAGWKLAGGVSLAVLEGEMRYAQGLKRDIPSYDNDGNVDGNVK